jgi:uncharacterized SAM-binding protein YcdF (DUF218 family)
LLAAAGGVLVEDDGWHKAQAALVLGGDQYGTRILTAAQLAQAGYVPYVFVSGPPGFLGHFESEYSIDYAKSRGYPGSLFRPVPSRSDSTRSETAFLGNYLRQQGVHSIVLVTSNYHTHRAAYLMRKQNPGLEVYVVPAPDPFFSPDRWWKSRTGQKTFLLEWTKTISTWMGI